MNIPTLKFPAWEQIKNLDLENNEDFSFIVFGTISLSLEGQITCWSEYHKNNIITKHIAFDVLEHGYADTNECTLIQDFTEEGYKTVCEHAQNIYKKIITELLENIVVDWSEWINEYCTNP